MALQNIIFIKIALVLLVVEPMTATQQCGLNEKYEVCGNLCEDSCDNRCEPSSLQLFADLTASNPDCVPGCYCEPGFLRNRDGACVLNTPSVCGKENNRCKPISKYAVYQKCVAGVPPACFERTIAIKVAGFTGRCVCQTGYSLALNRKCVKTTSRECKNQKTERSNLLFLQTTDDC